MSSIKEMFESWRSFLDETIMLETISDRSLNSDATNAKTFVKFFVRSKETAILAVRMIESSISDYEYLKSLPIESDEYRVRAKSILRDENAVAESEIIDKYIDELKSIRLQLLEEIQHLK